MESSFNQLKALFLMDNVNARSAGQDDSGIAPSGTGTAPPAAPTPSINPIKVITNMVLLRGVRLRRQRADAHMGRRTGRRKEWPCEVKYLAMDLRCTPRSCYVHPDNPASHWEVNTHDKSYRRPVCAGCVN